MLDTVGNSISVGFGALVAIVMLLALVLGAVGPAWEGTKNNRDRFWIIFLPRLIFIILLSFWSGKVFG